MLYVFEVHLGPGYAARQYADAWVRASEIIQQAAGARGTRLHRKFDDPSVLLAIAQWDSKPARDLMESDPDPEVQRIIRSQSRYVDIRVIGEFRDPEWIVLPPGENRP